MTDRNKVEYKGCIAIMGSFTNAQKAQKVLSAAAIPTKINKTDATSAHRGCVWSIQFSCNQLQNVKSVLSSHGINVRSWEALDV